MLSSELQSLRTRVKALSETVEALTAKNALLLAEKAAGHWVATSGKGDDQVTSLIQGYVQEIEELRARLLEAEAMYQQLKKRQMQVRRIAMLKDVIELIDIDKIFIRLTQRIHMGIVRFIPIPRPY